MSNKFAISGGHIVHAVDGTALPADEPWFLLRGKDEVTLAALAAYAEVMERYPESANAREHAAGTRERIAEIRQWQAAHPDRVGMGCGTSEHLRECLPGLSG